MLQCPDCKSSDVTRISLYDYECSSCGNVFDIIEALGHTDDWFPDDAGEDDEGVEDA